MFILACACSALPLSTFTIFLSLFLFSFPCLSGFPRLGEASDTLVTPSGTDDVQPTLLAMVSSGKFKNRELLHAINKCEWDVPEYVKVIQSEGNLAMMESAGVGKVSYYNFDPEC